MPFVALRCPSSGGPLPPNAKRRVVVCAFCHASVTYDQWTAQRHRFRVALEAQRSEGAKGAGERLQIGAREYRVIRPIARGESSDVWLAERRDLLGDQVVCLESYADTCFVPAGCVALTEGRVSLVSSGPRAADVEATGA